MWIRTVAQHCIRNTANVDLNQPVAIDQRDFRVGLADIDDRYVMAHGQAI